MAQPMRFLEEVCEHIRPKNFNPDETRSGRWGEGPSLMGLPRTSGITAPVVDSTVEVVGGRDGRALDEVSDEG
eukprot:5996888-Amphidinium_carterae.1